MLQRQSPGAVAHAFLPRALQSSSLGLLWPQTPLAGLPHPQRGVAQWPHQASPFFLLKQSLWGPFPDQTPGMHSIALQIKNKTPSGFLSLRIGLRLQPNRVSGQRFNLVRIWVTQRAPQPMEPSSLFWNRSPSCCLMCKRHSLRVPQFTAASTAKNCYYSKWGLKSYL